MTLWRRTALRHLLLVIGGCAISLTLCAPAVANHPLAAESLPSGGADPAAVQAAIKRGLEFLLQTQNPDGSWGGAWDSLTTWSGWTWSNPESHRAWRVATTGLCCLALLEVEPSPAVEAALRRGLAYLAANALVKRPSEWDTMDCWAHIYGLQALAAALRDGRFNDTSADTLRRAAEIHLQRLSQSQSLSGGWGYLEFRTPRTARPQWATSFTTAAGIVALVEAQQAGLDVDPQMLSRAARAVRRCRLPNGAYTYSVQAIPHPRRIGSIDRVNGSLCRIQVCNLALHLAEADVPQEWLRQGIEVFFREHRFLDIARLKPVPHEAFYQNSGYFYLFGHYYAARAIELLPASERAIWWPKLQYELLKIQSADGSFWDYDHHAYDRPYGSAYALLALVRSLRDAAQLSDLPAGAAGGF